MAKITRRKTKKIYRISAYLCCYTIYLRLKGNGATLYFNYIFPLLFLVYFPTRMLADIKKMLSKGID